MCTFADQLVDRRDKLSSGLVGVGRPRNYCDPESCFSDRRWRAGLTNQRTAPFTSGYRPGGRVIIGGGTGGKVGASAGEGILTTGIVAEAV
jgi:hypothetical protein